jgi:hypothetical protein
MGMKKAMTLVLVLIFIVGGFYVLSTKDAEAPQGLVPEPVSSSTPTTPPTSVGKCYIGGCSSQICSDQPDMASTCEWREEYACYKTAKCERQASGACGWTATAELNICLKNSQSFNPDRGIY